MTKSIIGFRLGRLSFWADYERAKVKPGGPLQNQKFTVSCR
jgi:hypothetical protein